MKAPAEVVAVAGASASSSDDGPPMVERRRSGLGAAGLASGYRTDHDDVLKSEKSVRRPVVDWIAVDSLRAGGARGKSE